MRFALVLGFFFLAILLHGGFILFGGLLFFHSKKDQGTLQQVELLSADDAKKEEDKPEDPTPDEIKTEDEKPPDAAELVRNMDQPVVNDAPALDAASLGAIEAALNGQSGGGDFGQSLDFASGGRIGGTGKAGGMNDQLDNAFSLAEIDQKPRATFQTAPLYPSEMRGKKVEGVVNILFVVDASGKVVNPRVEKSTAVPFEKPALEAVRKWKFEPAIKGGQRVACKMRVPIRFQPS
jgi:protein TonB